MLCYVIYIYISGRLARGWRRRMHGGVERASEEAWSRWWRPGRIEAKTFQSTWAQINRKRHQGDSNPCGQNPMDF